MRVNKSAPCCSPHRCGSRQGVEGDRPARHARDERLWALGSHQRRLAVRRGVLAYFSTVANKHPDSPGRLSTKAVERHLNSNPSLGSSPSGARTEREEVSYRTPRAASRIAASRSPSIAMCYARRCASRTWLFGSAGMSFCCCLWTPITPRLSESSSGCARSGGKPEISLASVPALPRANETFCAQPTSICTARSARATNVRSRNPLTDDQDDTSAASRPRVSVS